MSVYTTSGASSRALAALADFTAGRARFACFGLRDAADEDFRAGFFPLLFLAAMGLSSPSRSRVSGAGV
jgi:hypothetical protein